MRVLLLCLLLWPACALWAANRSLCWLDCEADLTLLMLDWRSKSANRWPQLAPAGDTAATSAIWPAALSGHCPLRRVNVAGTCGVCAPSCAGIRSGVRPDYDWMVTGCACVWIQPISCSVGN